SHRRAALTVGLEFFRNRFAAPKPDGGGMSGIGKAQFSPLDIGYEIETGREHSRASLFENDGEGASNFREKLARVRGHAGMVLHETTNHARDESRADAVSHHVADQDTGSGFAERKNADEIA